MAPNRPYSGLRPASGTAFLRRSGSQGAQRMRAGILPHADLPHIIPNFRLARSLLRLGCDVRILGSDVVRIGKGHSEACSSSVEKFKFGESLALHNSADEMFLSWLERQIDSLQLDIVILDAVWQSLAYALPGKIAIHHAGLPDFRSEDMPTWLFVHPKHGKERWRSARNRLDALERSGRGVRALFYHVGKVSGLTLDSKPFDLAVVDSPKFPLSVPCVCLANWSFPRRREEWPISEQICRPKPTSTGPPLRNN